jgi:hypothetical protein
MTTNGEPAGLTSEEAGALRAENEALRAQLAEREPQGPLWRRVLAVVLALLAILAVVAAVQAVWVKATLSDEDRFVAALQPLPRDEAVAAALSVRIADGVVEAAGVEAWLEETLPSDLGFVAAPLTSAIEDLIADVAGEVVQSDAVTTAWTATLRVTHKGVSAVLSGNDAALVSEGGQVTIDLDQIAGVVIGEVEALGLDLPDLDVDLGQIVLYENDELAEVQAATQVIDAAGWFSPLVALLLIAAAVWAAPDRRWLTAFLGFGVVIGSLLFLAALRVSENATLDSIDDGTARAGAMAAWDTVFNRLRQGMWALIVVAFIIGLIAVLLGPSRRAQGIRTWGGRTVDDWRQPVAEEPSGLTAFLIEWKRTIQWTLVVLGLIFLLFGPDATALLVIVTTVVVLALVVLAEVLAGPTRPAAVPEFETADE